MEWFEQLDIETITSVPRCKCGAVADFACDYMDVYKKPVVLFEKTIKNKSGRDVRIKLKTPVVERFTHFASLNGCDEPLCIKCAHEIGDDLHVCDKHFNDVGIERAKIADEWCKENLKGTFTRACKIDLDGDFLR